MTLPTLDLQWAVFWTGVIASLGIVYDALEFFTARRRVLDGFFEWRFIRSRYYILLGRPVLSFVFDLLFAGRVFLWLTLAHGVAALLFPIVLMQNRTAAATLAGTVLVVHCLSNVRLLIGRDGADQMQTVVWAGLFCYCLPIGEWAQLASAAFIPAQLVLSYLISGIAKAASPTWRSGAAIALITRMATYCPRNLSRHLTRPATSFVLSWMTITFELGAPLLLLGGRWGAVVLIIGGMCFHLGIAFSMGLTTFVFAFVSAFPILYHFSGRIG